MAYLSGCPSLQCMCFIIKLQQLPCDCVCAVRVSLLTVMFSALMFELGPRCLQSGWCFWAFWFEPHLNAKPAMRNSDFTGIWIWRKLCVLQPHLKYTITNHLSNHCAAVLTKPSYLVSQLQVAQLMSNKQYFCSLSLYIYLKAEAKFVSYAFRLFSYFGLRRR